jgi:hypothetical protein
MRALSGWGSGGAFAGGDGGFAGGDGVEKFLNGLYNYRELTSSYLLPDVITHCHFLQVRENLEDHILRTFRIVVVSDVFQISC